MTDAQESGNQLSQKGAWISILAYITLTIVKLGVGWWSGSKALVADGVNNLTDVIGSVAVLFGLRVANRPADEDHRYGHQKAETVASIVVASIMGLVGLDVAFSAVEAVFQPDLTVPHIASLWVSLGAAVFMLFIYQMNTQLARKTGSKALEASALDNRSDALTSLGAATGIIGAHLGLPWLDPLAGVIVALLIIRTAWQIGFEAAHSLTDGFSGEALGAIRDRVAAVDGVIGVGDLRARHLGSDVAVEVTVTVEPVMSLVEAHRVSDQVEERLLGFMCIRHVHVHVEPARHRRAVRAH